MPNNNANSYNSRGKRRRNVLYTPLSFICICAALLFGMSVFFRVSEIEVIGSSTYTDIEIIEASGLEIGDNLFFINRSAAASRMMTRLPYIESGRIIRVLPNKLRIEVWENQALAYIESGGMVWSLDRNCKILGDTPSGIHVSGLEPLAPSQGAILTAAQEDEPKVAYLAEILKAVAARGMQGDIATLDISNLANPSFDYLGRFTVRIGRNEDVDYKISLLLNTVKKLAETDSGTIDLSIDKQARFRPD